MALGRGSIKVGKRGEVGCSLLCYVGKLQREKGYSTTLMAADFSLHREAQRLGVIIIYYIVCDD